MVDTVTGPVEIPADLRQQLMDAVTESTAIYAGRGSSLAVSQTLLSKHDRFGNSAVQLNSEQPGLTFFTRPKFNLTTSSIRQDPTLAMLDTLDPQSFMFSIRANLDSKWARSPQIAPIASKSPFFNDRSPFNIPMSNMLAGISGWPDFGVEYETTEPGHFSEDMTLARGSDWGRRTYDISCTFRDIQGGYLMSYFYYYLMCMALQMDGTIVAYPEDREANRLNNTISIYRFVMDPSMRTITKWAKGTGSFPTSVPIGDVFNFGPGDNNIPTSQQFTVNFKVNNVRYMDPRHLGQFNTLVKTYAGNIDQMASKIKAPVTASSNFAGLPFINLADGNNELMYLADKEELIDPTVATMEQIRQQIAAQTTAAASAVTTRITDE